MSTAGGLLVPMSSFHLQTLSLDTQGDDAVPNQKLVFARSYPHPLAHLTQNAAPFSAVCRIGQACFMLEYRPWNGRRKRTQTQPAAKAARPSSGPDSSYGATLFQSTWPSATPSSLG